MDYAAAVIDIVSSTPDPPAPAPTPNIRSGWAHKHGAVLTPLVSIPSPSLPLHSCANARPAADPAGYTYCTWKRRFIRLERSSLSYFKQESSTTPKGVIPLTAYSLCKVLRIFHGRGI